LSPERLRVLVSGMVAGVPGQGGATWAVLQWVLGLRRLGHDVMLVEPVAQLTPTRLAYFSSLVAEFGLGTRAALLCPGRRTAGIPYDRLAGFAQEADLLLNVAGMLTDPELTEPAPRRAYLDLDPAFTQLWQAVDGIDMRLGGHTHFVTVGLNVGLPGCRVPTCGLTWLTTPPPVVLDRWPVAGPVLTDGLTTVANWRSYGAVSYDGVLYGQRAHSWRRLIELPTMVTAAFLPALAIHTDERSDIAGLTQHGWRLLDPALVAGTPANYRAFVQGSRAEFGIAKSGYVESRSGWFSDRSACYLASGRPVIVQETGFSAHLPVGWGLMAYTGTADAAEAIAAVTSDYDRHRRAARAVAQACLDSDLVVGRLLDRIS
jgi:hypothetical protein